MHVAVVDPPLVLTGTDEQSESADPLTLKVTDPVGATDPSLFGNTVATKVTCCWASDGFGEPPDNDVDVDAATISSETAVLVDVS